MSTSDDYLTSDMSTSSADELSLSGQSSLSSLVNSAFSSGSPLKVALLGTMGGIGQPLALLLKTNRRVGHLALYDINNTEGLALDLSHIPTEVKVTAHSGMQTLRECLTGCHVVIIMTNRARPPFVKRELLFPTNAEMILEVAESCARFCPDAILCVVTNPLNAIVPVIAEVYKRFGVHDVKRILGVISVDVMRAKVFVGEALGISAEYVNCPVVGGHSEGTTVPLFSQCQPRLQLTREEKEKLLYDIRVAGNLVLAAKKGIPSTVGAAYAIGRFVDSVLRGLLGEEGIIDYAYVQNSLTQAEFYAMPIKLGKNGVDEVLDLGSVDEWEEKLIEKSIEELQTQIKMAKDYVAMSEKTSI